MDYSNLLPTLASSSTPQWTPANEQVSSTCSSLLSADAQTLLEPYTYISANPGKEFRTRLIDAFNLWLEVPEGDLEVIRRVVRMLHNASLL